VEDDVLSASALATILRRRGFDVLLATTIAQGLAMLKEQPALLLLDLMLPDGDGSVILAHVRNTNLPIRVIVTTAVSDPSRLADVQRLRPDVVIKKPIDLSGLLKSMEPTH
jgi:DNA-binding response OmpR family regulator